ncbi:MAG TPA: hypothetical protein VMW23_01185 [Sedimentisphaerales bacterium]|nr:hypothetical protein [Sedimentisphaerales bacterium]
MKDTERPTKIQHLRLWQFKFCFYVFSLLLSVLFGLAGWAVSSKVSRDSTSQQMLKGRTEDVVIGSDGTIELGLAAEVLFEGQEDVWSVNAVVAGPEAIFFGTSPNGAVYRYIMGKLEKIYPPKEQGPTVTGPAGPAGVNEPAGQTVTTEQYLANKHIFAMATDVSGRLLAGISGDECALYRFEAGRMKSIFEPNDAKYIFSIAVGQGGNIYLGTGPEGKVYELDAFGRKAKVIYDSLDKNILAVACGTDGFVYAGSDSRALIYKINPVNAAATVLYDSDQAEITALLFRQGLLYAAGTSAEVVKAQTAFASRQNLPGRPEAESPQDKEPEKTEGHVTLQIANKEKTPADKDRAERPAAPKPPKPEKASYVYKITGDGYVTDIFSQTAVFFCMAGQQQKLLVGTGNSGQLFRIDPAGEREQVIYSDRQASQITAAASVDGQIYIGMANPAKLVKLSAGFASEGTYTSDLVDAGQPARWGKLQLEADVPNGCRVLAASRSGNVKDVNDPTFSAWSQPVEVTGPVQLQCPVGRFCQYKLILQTDSALKSPVIREVAVASTVPNLAPKVESVSVTRIPAADKAGRFKIDYKAGDDNKDQLIYKIDFRKISRTNWIELKDRIETETFEWDGRTVEDGRYEVRVTASDERSNTPATKLTDARISDPVIVDNTPPEITGSHIKQSKGGRAKITFTAADELSAIAEAHFTVNSNDEWRAIVPDDLVYDTLQEDFTVVVEELKAGENVIALKVADDPGNVVYKTFQVTVNGR